MIGKQLTQELGLSAKYLESYLFTIIISIGDME